jgi:hypothetical protein
MRTMFISSDECEEGASERTTLMECLEMEQSGLAFPTRHVAVHGEVAIKCDCLQTLSCARWRRMVGLNRNARPLLSFVGGKRHAASEDHEPDNKRAPDSAKDDSDSDSDNDNDKDKSGLGELKKRPNLLRAPRSSSQRSSVVPAKRGAEPEDPLDSVSFTSSSSQSKRPAKTFSKKPSFTARNKVARQEKTG